jgi:hypothetical protein
MKNLAHPSEHVKAILQLAQATQEEYEEWQHLLDALEPYDLAGLYFLLENRSGTLSEIIERWGNSDIDIYPGSEQEAAREVFDAVFLHEVPKHLQPYIDYESFGRDCRYEGSFREFMFCGRAYTCTNNNHV